MMCNECGKEFPLLYPTKYVYKRGAKYFCSWTCMRHFDKEKEKMNKKIDTAPAKRPGRPKKTETPAVLKVDGPLKIETPEANKVTVAEVPEITKPMMYDGMIIREVEGAFGRYRRSDIGDKIYIDVEPTDGCDTLSYTVGQWESFMAEHRKASRILGVNV